jgi:hypothetical protein
MIHTFKFEPKFSPTGEVTLGTIPVTGRIVKAEPISENGRMLFLIVVDDDPEPVQPIEHYRS